MIEIAMQNIRLRTIIGINNWERENKQDVIISVSFRYDASEAIEKDNVSEAVNYKLITKKIISSVESSSFNLLESLANMVYRIIKEDSRIEDIEVIVEKPFALRFSDGVSCRISEK